MKNQLEEFSQKFYRQDEDFNKLRISNESVVKNISSEHGNLEYEYNSFRLQAESKINKLTDEVRFKESEIYTKLEDHSRLNKKIEELNRAIKMRDNELLAKEKDNQDTIHRLKLGYDKNQQLENNVSSTKDEVDNLNSRISEIRKTNENLGEK